MLTHYNLVLITTFLMYPLNIFNNLFVSFFGISLSLPYTRLLLQPESQGTPSPNFFKQLAVVYRFKKQTINLLVLCMKKST